MFHYKNRYHIILRVISLILVHTFFVSNLVWADPDVFTPKHSLARWTAMRDPNVAPSMTAKMYRDAGLVHPVQPGTHYYKRLEEHQVVAFRIPAGGYVVKPETFTNDRALVEAVEHAMNVDSDEEKKKFVLGMVLNNKRGLPSDKPDDILEEVVRGLQTTVDIQTVREEVEKLLPIWRNSYSSWRAERLAAVDNPLLKTVLIEHLDVQHDVGSEREEDWIHYNCAEVLARIGGPEVIQAFIDKLGYSDAGFTYIAALGKYKDPITVEPLLKELYRSVTYKALYRVAIISALGEIGDPRAVDPLADLLLEEQNPYVKEKCALALNKLGYRRRNKDDKIADLIEVYVILKKIADSGHIDKKDRQRLLGYGPLAWELVREFITKAHRYLLDKGLGELLVQIADKADDDTRNNIVARLTALETDTALDYIKVITGYYPWEVPMAPHQAGVLLSNAHQRSAGEKGAVFIISPVEKNSFSLRCSPIKTISTTTVIVPIDTTTNHVPTGPHARIGTVEHEVVHDFKEDYARNFFRGIYSRDFIKLNPPAQLDLKELGLEEKIAVITDLIKIVRLFAQPELVLIDYRTQLILPDSVIALLGECGITLPSRLTINGFVQATQEVDVTKGLTLYVDAEAQDETESQLQLAQKEPFSLSEGENVTSALLTIGLELGIHVRSANRISRYIAEELSSFINISICKGEKTANARSAMSLVTLAAEKGDVVKIIVEGSSRDKRAEVIRDLASTLAPKDGSESTQSTISGTAKTAVGGGVTAILSAPFAVFGVIPTAIPFGFALTATILSIHAIIGYVSSPVRPRAPDIFKDSRELAHYTSFKDWFKDTKEALFKLKFNKLFALITHEPFHIISRSYLFAYPMQAILITGISMVLFHYLSIPSLSTLGTVGTALVVFGMVVQGRQNGDQAIPFWTEEKIEQFKDILSSMGGIPSGYEIRVINDSSSHFLIAQSREEKTYTINLGCERYSPDTIIKAAPHLGIHEREHRDILKFYKFHEYYIHSHLRWLYRWIILSLDADYLIKEAEEVIVEARTAANPLAKTAEVYPKFAQEGYEYAKTHMGDFHPAYFVMMDVVTGKFAQLPGISPENALMLRKISDGYRALAKEDRTYGFYYDVVKICFNDLFEENYKPPIQRIIELRDHPYLDYWSQFKHEAEKLTPEQREEALKYLLSIVVESNWIPEADWSERYRQVGPAVIALGYLKDKRAIPNLTKIVEDLGRGNLSLAETALWALKEITGEEAPSQSTISTENRENRDDIRKWIRNLTAGLGGIPGGGNDEAAQNPPAPKPSEKEKKPSPNLGSSEDDSRHRDPRDPRPNYSYGEGTYRRHEQADAVVAFFPKAMLKHGRPYRSEPYEEEPMMTSPSYPNRLKIEKAIGLLRDFAKSYPGYRLFSKIRYLRRIKSFERDTTIIGLGLSDLHRIEMLKKSARLSDDSTKGKLEELIDMVGAGLSDERLVEEFQRVTAGNRRLKKMVEKIIYAISLDLSGHLLLCGIDRNGESYNQVTHIGRHRRIIYLSNKLLDLFDINNPLHMEELASSILNHDQIEIDYYHRRARWGWISRQFIRHALSYEEEKKAHKIAEKDDPFKANKRLKDRIKRITRLPNESTLEFLNDKKAKVSAKIDQLEREKTRLEKQGASADELRDIYYDIAMNFRLLGLLHEMWYERRKAFYCYKRALGSLKVIEKIDIGLLPIDIQIRIIYLCAKEGMTESVISEFRKFAKGQFIIRPLVPGERALFKLRMRSFNKIKEDILNILEHIADDTTSLKKRADLEEAINIINKIRYVPEPNKDESGPSKRGKVARRQLPPKEPLQMLTGDDEIDKKMQPIFEKNLRKAHKDAPRATETDETDENRTVPISPISQGLPRDDELGLPGDDEIADKNKIRLRKAQEDAQRSAEPPAPEPSESAVQSEPSTEELRTLHIATELIERLKLHSGDHYLTEFIRDKLVEMDPRVAVPLLTKAFEETTDEYTRERIIEAFALIGPEAAPAIPALTKALDETKDNYTYWIIAEALALIGSKAVPVLITALEKAEDDFIYRIAEALAILGPEAAPAVPALIAAFERAKIDDATLWSIADELSQIGTAAIPALKEILNKAEDDDIRRIIADILSGIEKDDVLERDTPPSDIQPDGGGVGLPEEPAEAEKPRPPAPATGSTAPTGVAPDVEDAAKTPGLATAALRLMAKDFNIMITYKCPFACEICLAQDAKIEAKVERRPDMDKETFYSIINQLKGNKRIHIVGTGEPLAYGKEDLLAAGVSQDFLDIVRYAAERIKEVWIVTNVYLVPEDISEARAFFAQFPENVVWLVSVDEYHERQMRKQTGKELRHIVETMETLAKEGRIKTGYNVRIPDVSDRRAERDAVLRHFGLGNKRYEDLFVNRIVAQGGARGMEHTLPLDSQDIIQHTYNMPDFFLFVDPKGFVLNSDHAAYMTREQRAVYKYSELALGNIHQQLLSEMLCRAMAENSRVLLDLGYVGFLAPIRSRQMAVTLLTKLLMLVALHSIGEVEEAKKGMIRLVNVDKGMSKKEKIKLIVGALHYLHKNNEDMRREIASFVEGCSLDEEILHSMHRFTRGENLWVINRITAILGDKFDGAGIVGRSETTRRQAPPKEPLQMLTGDDEIDKKMQPIFEKNLRKAHKDAPRATETDETDENRTVPISPPIGEGRAAEPSAPAPDESAAQGRVEPKEPSPAPGANVPTKQDRDGDVTVSPEYSYVVKIGRKKIDVLELAARGELTDEVYAALVPQPIEEVLLDKEYYTTSELAKIVLPKEKRSKRDIRVKTLYFTKVIRDGWITAEKHNNRWLIPQSEAHKLVNAMSMFQAAKALGIWVMTLSRNVKEDNIEGVFPWGIQWRIPIDTVNRLQMKLSQSVPIKVAWRALEKNGISIARERLASIIKNPIYHLGYEKTKELFGDRAQLCETILRKDELRIDLKVLNALVQEIKRQQTILKEWKSNEEVARILNYSRTMVYTWTEKGFIRAEKIIFTGTNTPYVYRFSPEMVREAQKKTQVLSLTQAAKLLKEAGVVSDRWRVISAMRKQLGITTKTLTGKFPALSRFEVDLIIDALREEHRLSYEGREKERVRLMDEIVEKLQIPEYRTAMEAFLQTEAESYNDLTLEEERALIILAKAGDYRAVERLKQLYMPMIIGIARRWYPNISLKEKIDYGISALLEAIVRVRHLEHSFRYLARRYIKGRIIDDVQKEHSHPGTVTLDFAYYDRKFIQDLIAASMIASEIEDKAAPEPNQATRRQPPPREPLQILTGDDGIDKEMQPIFERNLRKAQEDAQRSAEPPAPEPSESAAQKGTSPQTASGMTPTGQSLISTQPADAEGGISLYEQVSSLIREDKRRPRVLLVQSNIVGLNNFAPPLGLYYLRAALRKYSDAEVEILDLGIGSTDQKDIDERLVAKIRELQPDIIGISFTTTSSRNAYRIAGIVKDIKKNTIIVAGGPHVNAVSDEEVLRGTSFDCLVRGEGEISFSKFVSSITDSGSLESLSAIRGISFKYKDAIIPTGPSEIIGDLDSLPNAYMSPEEMALYDMWIVDREHPAVPILTSRGCPYGCTFCSHAVFGRRIRRRSVESVMEEIRYYYEKGYSNFAFIDDAFGVDSKWVARLCDAIIASGLNKKISWRATIRTTTVDYELLGKMKKAGCIGLAFGIESGSQRILDKIVRKGTTVAGNLRAVRLAKKVGIEEIRLFVMVGLPEETERDVRKTIEFVKKADPTNIGLSIAVPYPGSEWGANLDRFRTRLVNGYDHFFPYIKDGSTGKYAQKIPPVVHETAFFDKEKIAHLYRLMRSELAGYMYDVESNRIRFIITRLGNCIDIVRASGLQREFDPFRDLVDTVDLKNKYAYYIRKILEHYQEWRSLDRQDDELWDELRVEYPSSLADKAVMIILLLHQFASGLNINLDDAIPSILSPKQIEIERGPPPLLQLDRLANCILASQLLNEGKITRVQYDHILESYDNVIDAPPLRQIFTRLKNIGCLLSVEAISSIIRNAEESRLFDAQDLILIPSRAKPETELEAESSEVVAILKPPTTTRLDGSINLEFISEILTRLYRKFGYEVAGMRILSGDYLSRNETVLENLYLEASHGYRYGVSSEAVLRRIEEIYGQPDFERFFGCPFDCSMVIPARDLIIKYGLTEEELDALWAPARFPISIQDFEKRHNVKVRIVEDAEAVGELKEREVAIPRSMILDEDGVLKINWFEQKVPWGMKKVAQAVHALPVIDPRINEGKPVVIVNGHIPGLFRHFKRPADKKTIALLLRRTRDSKTSLRDLREKFLGDENMPDRNPKRTIRRDAFDGVFSIPESMRRELRGNNNVMHITANSLQCVGASIAIFNLNVSETAFGQFLMKNGYSLEQIEYLLSNPRVRRFIGGVYKNEPIFDITNKMDAVEALGVIQQYFPPYRIGDPIRTPSVSFDQHMKAIKTASLSRNRLTHNQIRPASVTPKRLEDLGVQEKERCRSIGDGLLNEGKVAVVLAAGGEGGRKIGYAVSDPTIRDKTHNTILNLRYKGRDISANLAEIRAAHIRGTQEGRKRNIQTMVMGNDNNLSHILQLWTEANFYGLDYLDLTFYPQNGIYRFNPSREDILSSKSVVVELRKVHDMKVEHGLLPRGSVFDVNKAVDEIMARNGEPMDLFRVDDGTISRRACGHLEMVIQPFLNESLAYLAEHGCEIIVVPNGDDMGFYIDPIRLGYFHRSGKHMMATLVEKLPGERGGVLADVDIERNGDFRTQLIERDNLPEDFDYSVTPYFNTNQNYFRIDGILEFFLKGRSLEENLRRYYALTQEQKLELVNEGLANIRFNCAIKPVRVGTDIASDGTPIQKMSAAGQLERLVGSMSQILPTEYILVNREDFAPIKVDENEERATAALMNKIAQGIPYDFSTVAGAYKKRESDHLSGNEYDTGSRVPLDEPGPTSLGGAAYGAGLIALPLWGKLALVYLLIPSQRNAIIEWLATKGNRYKWFEPIAKLFEKATRKFLFDLSKYHLTRYLSQSLSYAPGLSIRKEEPEEPEKAKPPALEPSGNAAQEKKSRPGRRVFWTRKKLLETLYSLYKQYTDEEIRKETGISFIGFLRKEYPRIAQQIHLKFSGRRIGAYQELEEKYKGVDLDPPDSRTITNSNAYIENLAIGIAPHERDVIYDAILYAARGLQERELAILLNRYGILGAIMTQKELAGIFNVVTERISQIEAKALRKMQHPLRKKRLIEYLKSHDLGRIAERFYNKWDETDSSYEGTGWGPGTPHIDQPMDGRYESIRKFEERAIEELIGNERQIEKLNQEAWDSYRMQIVPAFSDEGVEIAEGREVLKVARDGEREVNRFFRNLYSKMNWPVSEISNVVYELCHSTQKHGGGGIVTLRRLYTGSEPIGIEIVARDMGKGIGDVEGIRKRSVESFHRGGGLYGVRGGGFYYITKSIFGKEGEIAYETKDGKFIYNSNEDRFIKDETSEVVITKGTRVRLKLIKKDTLETLRRQPLPKEPLQMVTGEPSIDGPEQEKLRRALEKARGAEAQKPLRLRSGQAPAHDENPDKKGASLVSLHKILQKRGWPQVFEQNNLSTDVTIFKNKSIYQHDFVNNVTGYERYNDCLRIWTGYSALVLVESEDYPIKTIYTHNLFNCVGVGICAVTNDGRRVFYLSHFLTNSDENEKSDNIKETLEEVIAILEQNLGVNLKDAKVTMAGGSDYAGYKNAEKAKAFLIDKGISETNIDYSEVGEHMAKDKLLWIDLPEGAPHVIDKDNFAYPKKGEKFTPRRPGKMGQGVGSSHSTNEPTPEPGEDGNVSCGTICEAGHKGCVGALNEQIKEFYQTLAKYAGVTRDIEKEPLTSNEVIDAIVATREEYRGKEAELRAIRNYIQMSEMAHIQVFFAIPKGGAKLWWVRHPKTGELMYAGAHFNKEEKRIHLSLPLILSQGSPEEAAYEITFHDYKHILYGRHEDDEGMEIVREVALSEREKVEKAQEGAQGVSEPPAPEPSESAAQVQQAFSELNEEVRKNSKLNTHISKLNGVSQKPVETAKLYLCVPVGVLKNSADMALALQSMDQLKRRTGKTNTPFEKTPFELVITGVKEKEDFDAVNNLKDNEEVKKTLNLPDKFTVRIIEEKDIQGTVGEYPRNGYDASTAQGRATIIKEMHVGNLKEGEYMAIVTDAVSNIEAEEVEDELLERGLNDEHISIRILIRPEEKGKIMFSLSAIIKGWLEDIHEGQTSIIRRVLGAVISYSEELDQKIRAAWKLLSSA